MDADHVKGPRPLIVNFSPNSNVFKGFSFEVKLLIDTHRKIYNIVYVRSSLQ